MKILNRLGKLKWALLVLPTLALLGCPSTNTPITGTPKFVAINFYDDTSAHVDLVKLTAPETTIGSDLEFLEVSPIVEAEATSSQDFSLRLTGASTNLVSGTCDVSNYNVVIGYGNDLTPKVMSRMLTAQEAPAITVIDVNMIQTSNYDIYVTAPGTDLSTVSPDDTDFGKEEMRTLTDALHVGANFQVTLCLGGTKTVVTTFNAVASAAAGTNYVFVVGNVGGSVTRQQTEVQTVPAL
jgi:hypothetical protein